MGTFVSEKGRTRERAGHGGAVAAVIASIAVVVSTLAPMTAALADTAPADPADVRTPETVSTDLLPTPQIGNGRTNGQYDLSGAGMVNDQIVIGNTVYVGGHFNYARPFGAGPGEDVVDRANMLAYDLHTGELLPFAPVFNMEVKSLAASPDGTRLYAAGGFTKVNGVARLRVAAFDVASGALIAGFAPEVNAEVNDVDVSATTVYLAGAFGSVTKQKRDRFAAVDARTGAVMAWAPRPALGAAPDPTDPKSPLNISKTRGNAVLVSPDGSKVIVAGVFASMNDELEGVGMAALDATTAELLPWKVNETIKNGSDRSSIMDLTTDGTSVYGVGFQNVYDRGTGQFEGTFRASWSDGALEWMTDCHGDTYSAAVLGDSVYTASHAHYCAGVGGFENDTPSVSSDGNHRALAFTKERTGTLKPWTGGGTTYHDFGGEPAPSLLDWYPDLAPGQFTGLDQAAWDVTTSGDYVLYGGELTKVNGVDQRGLARFAVRSVAENEDGPQLSGDDMKPSVTTRGGTYVKLAWPANYDRDNARLTYQVIRDDASNAPVFETSADSRFWQRPTVTAADGPLEIGRTYTYRIRTVDPFGNATLGTPVTYTATGGIGNGGLTAYDKSILQDQPASYWPANEPATTTLVDWVGTDDLATASTARAVGVEKTSPKLAITFPGTEASRGRSSTRQSAPRTLSVEAWIKTTTKNGGKIVGFEADPTSGNYDRHLYMDKAGRVSFGVGPVVNRAVTSTKAVNDGLWHHVVGSVDPSGHVQLTIDGGAPQSRNDAAGLISYEGSWAVGGGRSWADGKAVTSRYFAGTIDNVAVYNRVLTPTDISRHIRSAQPAVVNVLPTAAFSTGSDGLAVSVDGRASSDPDGRIAAYRWDFGDGSAASDARSTHSYAKAGVYTVTLTVTDARGSTAKATRRVTMTALPDPEPETEPQPIATANDDFSRSLRWGWGRAVEGGFWRVDDLQRTTVDEGLASILLEGGSVRSMSLPEVATSSSDTTTSFTIDQPVEWGAQHVSVIGRQVGTEAYSARVTLLPTGELELQLRRGSTALKGVKIAAGVYRAGEPVHLRLQVSGTGTTSLAAKVWTGGTEPTGWMVAKTDTTASMQAAGSVGLAVWAPNAVPKPTAPGAEDGSVTVAFHAFRSVPVR